MNRARRLFTRPWFGGFLVAGLVAVAAGLYWFQPWRLWVDETVQDAFPAAASEPLPAPEPRLPAPEPRLPAPEPRLPAPEPRLPASPPPGSVSRPTGPVELGTGTLISHEHPTSGTVRVLRAADGSLVLRLEDLATSSGPDVHVWLTDAPVKPGKDGWALFDDGRHFDAGKLKGNKGNQNYALPAGTDLSGYTSVSLWCDRFNVSFGAAELVGPRG
ncbi:DM13 domain-containing protein [Amycolatopsis sp. FBCC-B4732]|uniref:DM13 domain-containing protein n=1 Tax=Amycolatopsis sp. FBCC-B4732 TaxID=3079339 RepID=UPI001FF5EA02|nr:DM13 domain-containing protein [Amycolatopsis sp. FBCC-B4732]UOX93081.1 DM13 domain-containing protein [Amycolatopsis sp. FBCC-B4732]